MVDTIDSKSIAREGVRVQVSSPVEIFIEPIRNLELVFFV